MTEPNISPIVAIEKAAGVATKALAEAAQSAVHAVAAAAADASKLLSRDAEDAARALSTQRGNDHDAIVRISEKIDSLKADVKDLKDGATKRIENLEACKLDTKDSYPSLYKKGVDDTLADYANRFKRLEEGYVQVKTLGSIGLILLGILEVVLRIVFK